MIVVADTGPINYLVLIQQVHLLTRLFQRVVIPPAVATELQALETPSALLEWMAQPPAWLEIRQLSSDPDSSLDYLDEGEREALLWPRNWTGRRSCWMSLRRAVKQSGEICR